jgi:hypothetical protein
MVMSFSQKFIENRGQSFELDGKLVHAICQLNLEEGVNIFNFQRISNKLGLICGLRIKILKGEFTVNKSVGKETILWSDTSPTNVEIVIKSRKNCVLKIWNVWKHDALINAWSGNAGMHIEKTDEGFVLECSCSIREPNFADLVYKISYKH